MARIPRIKKTVVGGTRATGSRVNPSAPAAAFGGGQGLIDAGRAVQQATGAVAANLREREEQARALEAQQINTTNNTEFQSKKAQANRIWAMAQQKAAKATSPEEANEIYADADGQVEALANKEGFTYRGAQDDFKLYLDTATEANAVQRQATNYKIQERKNKADQQTTIINNRRSAVDELSYNRSLKSTFDTINADANLDEETKALVIQNEANALDKSYISNRMSMIDPFSMDPNLVKKLTNDLKKDIDSMNHLNVTEKNKLSKQADQMVRTAQQAQKASQSQAKAAQNQKWQQGNAQYILSMDDQGRTSWSVQDVKQKVLNGELKPQTAEEIIKTIGREQEKPTITFSESERKANMLWEEIDRYSPKADEDGSEAFKIQQDARRLQPAHRDAILSTLKEKTDRVKPDEQFKRFSDTISAYKSALKTTLRLGAEDAGKIRLDQPFSSRTAIFTSEMEKLKEVIRTNPQGVDKFINDRLPKLENENILRNLVDSLQRTVTPDVDPSLKRQSRSRTGKRTDDDQPILQGMRNGKKVFYILRGGGKAEILDDEEGRQRAALRSFDEPVEFEDDPGS